MVNTIYLITNSINDKVYVGQTWGALNARLSEHKYSSNRTRSKIGNAIAKYGKDSFRIEAIAITFEQVDADRWEQYFIDRYDSIKNGYNIKEGGSHGKHSEETKEKMRGENNPMFGRKWSDEQKAAHSLKVRGRKHTPAEIQRIIDARTGKPHPHKGTPRKGIKWSTDSRKVG